MPKKQKVKTLNSPVANPGKHLDNLLTSKSWREWQADYDNRMAEKTAQAKARKKENASA